MNEAGTKYIARDGQTVLEHLNGVAWLCSEFMGVLGLPALGNVCGLLHDLGKYTDDFQQYIRQRVEEGKGKRGDVIHALQAVCHCVEGNRMSMTIGDIIANVVASHHGELLDMVSDGERSSIARISKGRTKDGYREISRIPEVEELLRIVDAVVAREIPSELRTAFANGTKLANSLPVHFIVKFAFSALVDADRCDAARMPLEEALGTVPDWVRYAECIERKIHGFSATTPINKVRQKISDQCFAAASRQQGMYSLSVPTGSGKTLSSLRFAVEHARRHGLKRIVYVIPYLSIIDQTAKELRGIFADLGEDCILEHHSNVDFGDDENDLEEKFKLLTSRWDSPIIVTTMVQFLESVYSNKASALRKLHNMSESVLIFDEIQSIPPKCVRLFNSAVNFLSVSARSTVVLCTATQPRLDADEVCPAIMSNDHKLVELDEQEMEVFRRVNIVDMTTGEDGMPHRMETGDIADFVRGRIEEGLSTLVIMNTKRSAAAVYDALATLECERVFLSTDLCPVHRERNIETIRRNLSDGVTTLCVSTQLIEAGVDVSFDCVVRALANWDSIVQSAGRCNRHGESEQRRDVYIVDAADEKLGNLEWIKTGKEISRRVIAESRGTDLSDDAAVDKYFGYYFKTSEIESKFSYPIDGGDKGLSIHGILSGDSRAADEYRQNHLCTGEVYSAKTAVSFKTGADAFCVIDSSQIGVIVQYPGEEEIVNGLITELKSTYGYKERGKILRRLQKYMVNVYRSSENWLKSIAASEDEKFYLLGPGYYDPEKGLTREESAKGFLEI